MLARSCAIAVVLTGSLALGACAGTDILGSGNSQITTASVPPKPQVDPACVALAAHIDTLHSGGIADKIEKAAARKYRMKTADIAKANELTKANAEFRDKCSKVPRATTTTAQAQPGLPIQKPAGTGAATVATKAGAQVKTQ
jgi:hypothetical protein